MQLALKVPASAFRNLRTIITHTGYDEGKATELALEMAFALYRLAVRGRSVKVMIPLKDKPNHVYRIELFPRPKKISEEDTNNRSPLRVTISAGAHSSLKAIGKHYNLTDETTLWLSLQLMAEIVQNMARARTQRLIVLLADGRRVIGDIETPPKLT